MLIINIKELLQIRTPEIKKVSGTDMATLPSICNAWLQFKNDVIIGFGSMESCPKKDGDEQVINADGKFVFPTWCDSHTHIVYAGNREQEFVDRINGLTYEEIAARGGGILNSAQKLNDTSEEDLYEQSAVRIAEVMRMGTGAAEIKTGYGLTTESELKMLRVIGRLRSNYPIAIKVTFLGAHAFPKKYKDDHKGYIELLINEMIPAVAKQEIAEYIDVFCESGYFSTDETRQILEAGAKFGLKPKIHVNQFNSIGGIKIGVEHNALTVDHLEVLTPDDIQALQQSETMPVALPSCSYFLSIPYTPAREIINAGLPLAIATDYNPGSTPSGNMNFVVSTACIKMKMTPEEAFNAATINGAYAMDLSQSHGSITVGKKANVIITKALSSWYQLPYSFGSNLIETVIVNGNILS